MSLFAFDFHNTSNSSFRWIIQGVSGIWTSLTVNFTNILHAAFSCKSFARSFLNLDLRFVLFWRKNIGAKAVRKMLVKLTPGGV
jgi:hypothetical protein